MELITRLLREGIIFLLYVIEGCILLRAFFDILTDGDTKARAYVFCFAITEPFVALCRKPLQKLGLPDFRVDPALLLAAIILTLVTELLEKFFP